LPSGIFRHSAIFARFAFTSFGFAAVIWGVTTFPIFWRDTPIEYIARHVVHGEAYRFEVLDQQASKLQTIENSKICRPIARWSAVVIRLRMLEQVEREGHTENTENDQVSLKKALAKSLRGSLFCMPTEPFLWLILWWLESEQDGLNYLRMSYLLGPNEGWIALKRNPLAFTHYDSLPADLKVKVMAEFFSLIRNEFYEEAADVFIGSAWRFHDVILSQLGHLPYPNRARFAKMLRDRNIDVEVPGIEPRPRDLEEP
jgi:hypothetical protein